MNQKFPNRFLSGWGSLQGYFILARKSAMTSPPTPLLQGEGRIFVTIKHKKLLITPPSLAGKGVGGLGQRDFPKPYRNFPALPSTTE